MTVQTILGLLVASFIFVIGGDSAAQTATGANQHAKSASANKPFDEIVSSFSESYRSLEIENLDLSYIENFKRLGSKETLLKQQAAFSKQLDEIALVDGDQPGVCQKIELSIMEIESQLGLARAKLALQHDATSTITDEGIYHQPNGKEWYRYYLARWNGAWLEFDQLYAFGENELAKAVAAYDKVQLRLGYKGDDIGLARHIEESQRFTGDKNTLAWFESQQDLVWTNLSLLFTATDGVKKAAIKSSDRGSSFPVPGYYDPPTETFYFNQFKDYYEGRQADWLLLHEATPGHHYQIASANLNPRCPQRLPRLSYSAYSEGWAAYVETLGEQLGVYQSLEARLAAIEWNMVRSVRVVLDVGINAYGWSNEQAMDYWVKHVRGQQDIAQREIDRMRRWPAQVVTYKYGAEYFERLRDELVISIEDKDKRNAAIRQYHDVITSFRSMPPSTFERVLPELMRN